MRLRFQREGLVVAAVAALAMAGRPARAATGASTCPPGATDPAASTADAPSVEQAAEASRVCELLLSLPGDEGLDDALSARCLVPPVAARAGDRGEGESTCPIQPAGVMGPPAFTLGRVRDAVLALVRHRGLPRGAACTDAGCGFRLPEPPPPLMVHGADLSPVLAGKTVLHDPVLACRALPRAGEELDPSSGPLRGVFRPPRDRAGFRTG